MNKSTKDRAGRYIKQPKGYVAFIPADLPPVPPINITNPMYTLISDADRALGRLDGATETLPNPDLFVFMYVNKEAAFSSQIEGTQASMSDVLEADSKDQPTENKDDIEEIKNYIKAMKYGLTRLENLPMSLRLIREIHERLMDGVRGRHHTPGEFRTSQNWIGPPNCTLNTATFIPPPPHEMLRSLDNFEKFIHSTNKELPILVKAGLLHAQFETIHPFLDGNGRVGRLLITFYLCQSNLLRWPSLYLSAYFKQHQQEYYAKLKQISDTGDWESWLQFFLQGVLQVAREATSTARNIVQMREGHRSLIAEKLSGAAAANGYKLLEALYKQPIINIQQAARFIEISEANANTLVEKFEKIGILQETTGKKKYRIYRYTQYLELFEKQQTITPRPAVAP